MPSSRKIGALDGLRVLAIAAIVVYHANPTWLPGGYLGVSVFFVLTGYLITLSVEREIARTGRLDYPRFLMRRVGRLLPTMLAVVGVSALLCALFAAPLLPKVKSDALPSLLFVGNLSYLVRNVSYFAAAGLPSPLTHFWFLGVTMQFYLVWPLALQLLSHVVRHRRGACVVVAALACASAVEMALLYDPTGDTTRIYYAPDTRAAELLVGALCALLTRGRGWRLSLPARFGAERSEAARPLPGWAYDVAGAASLALIGLMMVTLNGYSDFAYRGGILLVSLLTALFVGVVARPAPGLLARALGWAPLVAAGRRGFALYLWHYPLLLVMNPATRTTALPWWGWALELALIAAVSELSWRLFERPSEGGALRARLAGQSAPALALEALGALAVLVLAVVPLDATATGVPADQKGPLTAASEAEAPSYDVSDTYLAGTAFAAAVDTINNLNYAVDAQTGATDASVLLIGDSVPAGAASQFQSVFPNGWIDAEVGRQIYDAPAVYEQCVADGHGADNVVWSVADNGVAREEQVRALIDACGADKRVFLVTVRVPLALQDLNNQTLVDVAADYDNVEVVDWHAESEGHDEWFWGDGTHLRPEGAEAYVMMLRRAITGR
ncbi:acyltransferase family protein [Thermophilibacter immobilis]|jgi:peptidoglycan/LPS O-acetylase OafA/YrhL|uniref:Acetyltransferase n=1 Tax=Thermophilibacter immobilis TaxID=2779519 RepID=A0A7S7M6X1_9ACTN|nr:acyltransferase family protein [Thermophilibacter immobilis]QOY59846.1 acetyltransferase [Thermophilibacter immobilis]